MTALLTKVEWQHLRETDSVKLKIQKNRHSKRLSRHPKAPQLPAAGQPPLHPPICRAIDCGIPCLTKCHRRPLEFASAPNARQSAMSLERFAISSADKYLSPIASAAANNSSKLISSNIKIFINK
jgi:hypothetical protein